MRFIKYTIFFLGIFVLSSHYCIAGTKSEIESEKLLYNTFFYGDYYDAEKIPANSLPEYARERVGEYVKRFINYKSRIEKSHIKLPARLRAREAEMLGGAYLRKRRNIEKAIVSLVNEKEIEDLAADYALNAKLYYEWEGSSDAPLGEAMYAIKFLKGKPDTPLEPYLTIFIVNRLRHSLNGFEYEKQNRNEPMIKYDEKQHNETLKTYNFYLDNAKKHADPLVKCLSIYIANAESLYD